MCRLCRHYIYRANGTPKLFTIHYSLFTRKVLPCASVAFIYLLLFSTLKCAKSPVFMRVFDFFVLLKSSLVPSKKYDTTKVLIWDELLFLFFVSITLFVEIMSRISNCFFNFKLRCEKGDDGFCHRPLGLISIYLLLAILLFLSTTVSVITAPPLTKRSAIQRNIWLLSPVAGEFAFAWTLKVPSVLPSV